MTFHVYKEFPESAEFSKKLLVPTSASVSMNFGPAGRRLRWLGDAEGATAGLQTTSGQL